MISVRVGLLLAATGQVFTLVLLASAGGTSLPALGAGLAYGVGCDVLIVRGLRSSGAGSIGPANGVTWLRCVLVGVVVALVAEGLTGPPEVPTVLLLSAGVPLLLDAVDGRIARLTGTVSPFGARFDMEVDASLILVLSVAAVQSVGPWVLVIGAARYLLLIATVAAPWLNDPIPASRWRKAVAAVQGVVLTLVSGGVVTSWEAVAMSAAAAVALGFSFSTQIGWLARERRRAPALVVPEVFGASHV
jgi:phosphatidylglycerophosphate synthase